VHIYRHATLTNDLSIHLHLKSSDDAQRSILGTHLAQALQEHGMVEHTVWFEDAQDASRRGEP
jgi:hypothetical protein